ncbi:MAG: hypothetical protein JST44_01195 [Cyanobacteria bacterium SZAS LIN-5]|nr:hypothetical protein [Cyanobacteria bacterium SZAS LIN-5]
MSNWPVAADYDESIQNPHLNFEDSELKEGEPEYDPYGSPAVRSGNFASVYMLQGPRRKVAVRCFLREIPDQQERYAAISRDLLGLGLPYTVNFEFLPKGIKVQGEWFPILKMDWCEGEQLDKYLERNLENQAKLRRLADKWFEMSHSLRKVGIAHGDLSHGNVMVLDDEIKLIDYDGMFVPRLAGRKSNERGLEHYQHPGRTDNHFGRYLDNFSNWVMYTTLVGLGEDKELWKLVNIADKHLIFSKSDFEHPNRSKTFDILKSHEDKTLRTYATTVENLLQYDVEQIPDFHPDKPVLYPPEAFQAKKPASAGVGDRGGLFKPIDDQTLGDRGRLFETTKKESDRGGLFADTGKEPENKPEPPKSDGISRYGRKLGPAQIAVGSLATVAIIALVGFGVFTSMKHETPESILTDGIDAEKLGKSFDARKKFLLVSDDDKVDAKIRSKAHTLMGLSYAKEGLTKNNKDKMDEAKESFTKAIALDSTNADAFYGRGKIYEARKNFSDAKSDFASSERLDSNVEDYKTALKNVEDK